MKEYVIVCAWCGRYKVRKYWYSVTRWVPKGYLSPRIDEEATISHGICNDCQRAMLKAAGLTPILHPLTWGLRTWAIFWSFVAVAVAATVWMAV